MWSFQKEFDFRQRRTSSAILCDPNDSPENKSSTRNLISDGGDNITNNKDNNTYITKMEFVVLPVSDFEEDAPSHWKDAVSKQNEIIIKNTQRIDNKEDIGDNQCTTSVPCFTDLFPSAAEYFICGLSNGAVVVYDVTSLPSCIPFDLFLHRDNTNEEDIGSATYTAAEDNEAILCPRTNVSLSTLHIPNVTVKRCNIPVEIIILPPLIETSSNNNTGNKYKDNKENNNVLENLGKDVVSLSICGRIVATTRGEATDISIDFFYPAPNNIATLQTNSSVSLHVTSRISSLRLWEGQSSWQDLEGEDSALYLFVGRDNGLIQLWRVDVSVRDSYALVAVFVSSIVGTCGIRRTAPTEGREVPDQKLLTDSIMDIELNGKVSKPKGYVTVNCDSNHYVVNNNNNCSDTTIEDDARLIAGSNRRWLCWSLENLTPTGFYYKNEEVSGDALVGRYVAVVSLGREELRNSIMSHSTVTSSDNKEREMSLVTGFKEKHVQLCRGSEVGTITDVFNNNHCVYSNTTTGESRTDNQNEYEIASNIFGEKRCKILFRSLKKPVMWPVGISPVLPKSSSSSSSQTTFILVAREPILVANADKLGMVYCVRSLGTSRIVTGGEDGAVRVWEWNTSQEAYSLAFATPDRQVSEEENGDIFPLSKGNPSSSLNTTSLDADGEINTLLSTSGPKTLVDHTLVPKYMCKLQQDSGKSEAGPRHRDLIRCIVVLRAPDIFITASYDGTVREWHIYDDPHSILISRSTLLLSQIGEYTKQTSIDDCHLGVSGISLFHVYPSLYALFVVPLYEFRVRSFALMEVATCEPPENMFFNGEKTIRFFPVEGKSGS